MNFPKAMLTAAAVCLILYASASEAAIKKDETAPDGKKVNRAALLNPKSPDVNATAPDSFQVKLETTRGDIVLQISRDLSPLGVDRFYSLVTNGYYDDVRFFRVVSGFMVQFGIHGDPAVSKSWVNAGIRDEPVKRSNTRGTITFAKRGTPNSRTTQLFINFGNNTFLDAQGFSPFGSVVEGMSVVDSLYAGYGEGAPRGAGPDQGRAQAEGNAYFQAEFPRLDYIKRATVLK